MPYRPYPSRERSLKQVGRHAVETPPMLWSPRPLSEFEKRFFEASAVMVRTVGASLAAMAEGMRRPAGEWETTT
jgi:hypothetical protein